MFVFTALSNLLVYPTLIVTYKNGLYYIYYLGIFTSFTSLMYHTLESFQIELFLLHDYDWHRLGNPPQPQQRGGRD